LKKLFLKTKIIF